MSQLLINIILVLMSQSLINTILMLMSQLLIDFKQYYGVKILFVLFLLLNSVSKGLCNLYKSKTTYEIHPLVM